MKLGDGPDYDAPLPHTSLLMNFFQEKGKQEQEANCKLANRNLTGSYWKFLNMEVTGSDPYLLSTFISCFPPTLVNSFTLLSFTFPPRGKILSCLSLHPSPHV